MHRKTETELLRLLKTSGYGLTTQEASARLKQYGFNQIESKRKKPLILSFLEEFTDIMVIILIIAALIAGFSGEKTDASVILFIVLLNASIGFTQKYKAEKALEALQKMLSPQTKVIRNGKIMQIPAKEVVIGDLLLLGEGDNIAADARVINENELQVDESALTGESLPVQKSSEVLEGENLPLDAYKNTIFMGTAVTHGTAKAIVVRTGMNSEFGKIANLTQTTTKEKSPLQKELFKIGVFAGKVTILICLVLLLVVWLLQGGDFLETFLFATSIAVAAVPEGLPTTVTIALAIGVQRLARKKSIIKKLTSVETLGSTTVICSDKTGTLTKNQMTVVEAYLDENVQTITGTGYNPVGKWEGNTDSKTLQKLCETALLCNNSRLDNEGKKWKILGDPTEGALWVAASKTTFKSTQITKDFRRLHELPFDSTRKMMTTLDQEKSSKKITAHLKGAPDEVLKVCTHYYHNGEILKLTSQKREAINTENEKMGEKALRVLAFAERMLEKNEIPENIKQSKTTLEKNMVFIGLMGMIDPAREEVYDAVAMAHQAGIKIYMVTGDHATTAKAIAKKLKIIENDAKIFTGIDLNMLTETQLSQIFKTARKGMVFARVSPEHKLKIVNALKKNGEIVAMTGDGVNDAPALKKADIGIAIGITGTDVSKEAADMILVDDSFGTIVTAVSEGRTIYNNLKKFVFYMFSCNIAELLTIAGAILLGLPSPLSAILILTVNLGTDVLPALALGVDPPESDIMNRKPRSSKEHILQKDFVVHFIYLGCLMGFLVISTYIIGLKTLGWNFKKASTVTFVLLVMIQMVNAFNVRSITQSITKAGFLANQWLLGAVIVSLLTVWACVENNFLQTILGTTHLSLKEWLSLIAIASMLLVFEEIRKFIKNLRYV